MSNHRPILEARDLEVQRGGVRVMDIPSLTIHEGEVLALIGPNGAGKTTLLQALCHLYPSFRGKIVFRGQVVGEGLPVFDYRRKISMVFQESLLFDTTVFQNVAAGLKFRRMKTGYITSTVLENLDRFGIVHLRDRSARTLSGGEAQRTSLARAFATRPEILLLDEPFAALDPPTREGILEDLDEALNKSGTTTVFATHDRMEALRLADRIAVMKQGRTVQINTPEEVMNHPADEFVAGFVGVETIVKGRVVRRGQGSFVVSVSGHEVEAVGDGEVGDHVILCIRPENVVLQKYAQGLSTSARNVFSATITRIDDLGFYQKVALDCGFPLCAYVTRASLDEMPLRTGDMVQASFKATGVHAIIKRQSQTV